MATLLLFVTIGFWESGDGAKVGKAAPKLSVDEWVQGEPVPQFQRGVVYIVELWGTWCSPCIKNIPKLSDLQSRFADRGLVVIGVASHEFKGRDALTTFMTKKGDMITYRIAYDGDLSIEKDWDTGGREGVVFRMPICFIVDRGGIVVYAGHPESDGFEPSLEKALAGS